MLAASATFWLGLYGAVVSTVVGIAALHRETFRRIKIGASEDFLVNFQGGRQVVMGADAVLEHEIPDGAGRPILSIRVINRGRHPVQVRTLSKAYWTKIGRMMLDEPMRELPLMIEPGRYHDFHVGTAAHDYEHGSLGRLSRFYIIDGVDRVYPVRERWNQRLENLLYRRVIVWHRRRRRRQEAERAN